MKTLVKSCVAVCLLALLAVATGYAQDSAVIQPGTPEAAKVIATLKHRERHDRDQAQSYTDGSDSDRGMFYSQKADEIQGLINKLQQGQAVSKQDVHHAMNNAHAVRYGP
jgi:hypothetical protein